MTREEIMQHGVTISRRITRPEYNPRGLVSVRARAWYMDASYVPSYRIPLDCVPDAMREELERMERAHDEARGAPGSIPVIVCVLADLNEAEADMLAEALKTYGEKQ